MPDNVRPFDGFSDWSRSNKIKGQTREEFKCPWTLIPCPWRIVKRSAKHFVCLLITRDDFIVWILLWKFNVFIRNWWKFVYIKEKKKKEKIYSDIDWSIYRFIYSSWYCNFNLLLSFEDFLQKNFALFYRWKISLPFSHVYFYFIFIGWAKRYNENSWKLINLNNLTDTYNKWITVKKTNSLSFYISTILMILEFFEFWFCVTRIFEKSWELLIYSV